MALASSRVPIVVAATPLGVCEWCPDETVTGERPADAELVVAHQAHEKAFTHRGEVCAGHLGMAERDAIITGAEHIWFELPIGQPEPDEAPADAPLSVILAFEFGTRR